MLKVSVVAAMAAVFISACGGGSGGGGGTGGGANVPFSASNYDPAGRAAAAAIVDVSASTGASDVAAAAPDAGGAAGFPTNTLALARRMMEVAQASASGRESPQASEPDDVPCLSGTGTAIYTDNGAPGLSESDVLSATLNACVVEAGGAPVSGSFSLAFNTINVSLGGEITGAELTLTLTNFSTQGTSQSGTARIAIGATSTTVTYDGLRSTRGGTTNVYNYSATVTTSGGSERVSFAGSMVLGLTGGSYTISTPTPLTIGALHPNAGTMRLTDPAGGYIDVIASPTTFTINLYLPGDSARDATVTHTWADLAAGRI